MDIDKVEWVPEFKEIEFKEPKTDCFAYDDTAAVPSCKALTDLYCRKEKCRFYKPGNWDDIVNRTKTKRGEQK